MKQMTLIIFMMCIFQPALASDKITKITCSFKAEDFEGGKSNSATCAMNPQSVFSTRNYQHPNSEMCDQKSNSFQENYVNFTANLTNRTIIYDRVSKLSDFAKPNYIRQTMADGATREEATRKADEVFSYNIFHEIDNVDISKRTIYLKPSGGLYSPPKEINTYIIRYGEKILNYTANTPEAVILEVTGDESRTWVAMKFGHCESE